MRVRSRVSLAVTAPLIAALAAGACGDSGGSGRSGGDSTQPQRTAEASRPATPTAPAWSKAKVLRRLADKVVVVDGRRVRVDSATVTCGGVGPASVRAGVHVWHRFVCVQPTFGGEDVAGPDAVLSVEPTGPRSLRIVDTRFTRY
jgi:hypothetical protein